MTDDPLDPRVRASLDGLGVEAEVMPCDPDLADTAAFCEAYGVAPEDSANCILVGGVTPFGLPESLPVFVDGRVMTRDRVVVGGGSRSAKLRITPGQLLRIRGAQVVDGLAG